MNSLLTMLRLLPVCIMLVCLSAPELQAQQNTTKPVLSKYYDLVYQIRVISPKAGSKSSIGSGFQVSADGLIVTNFHVVSDYVNSPNTYRINYRSHDGMIGDLQLISFDVVNDLAILRHPEPGVRFLQLAKDTLIKGETVYALGNPRDYGVSLVPGPNNGLVEHSYNPQILFSGSLNPGMSGGPTLNKIGQVVGVNVATAGSQLSFLIPTNKVVRLLQQNLELDSNGYQNEISRQIKSWQRPRIQQLIDQPWPGEKFANEVLFGEIRKDFQCWGGTNEENKERYIATITKNCRAGNSLYLGSRLDAGQIHIDFSKKKSLKLNTLQFASSVAPVMGADNYSNYQNSTNYQCHVDFVKNTTEQEDYSRVTTCIRAYKKLDGLFDSLVLVERVENRELLSAHLSLSAVEQGQIMDFNRKFIDQLL